MGYSCSAKASQVCQKIEDHCYNVCQSTNVYIGNDGNKYMFEVGREQKDMSITGVVHKFIDQTNFIEKVGSFKIDKEGRIVRFPHLPKDIKRIAESEGLREFHKIFNVTGEEEA